MPEIKFEDFKNLDMRVGKVLEAKEIPESKNLLLLQVDFREEKLQAVSGIKGVYLPENLVGKKFVFVLNLERKKFLGYESQCMILAAEDSNGKIVLLQPAEDIEPGSKIR